MATLEERFWSKVDVCGPNECWEWQAASANGYGSFRVGSKRDGTGRAVNAHRLAWELHNGRKLRRGKVIAHKPTVCHNRLCCNPAHLREATQRANQRDRWEDGTHTRGVRHGMSKLTESQVLEMRTLRASGLVFRIIAAKFGVALSTAHQVCTNKRWRHL